MDETDNTELRENTNKVIRTHMMWAMGAGLLPVPIADFFAVSAIQLDMVRQMCKLYEIDFKEKEGKAIISALTTTGLARLGANAAKFIPGVGSVLGGVTMSVLSGASTYALGEVFKRHFETGGTILDFDVERLKQFYREKFEKGKKVAQDLKREQERKQKKVERMEDTEERMQVIDKLKELASLKESGVLSEEEFNEMKEKLLKDF